jgi:TrAA12-like
MCSHTTHTTVRCTADQYFVQFDALTKTSVMSPLLSLNSILFFVLTAGLLLPHVSAQTACTPISAKIAPVVAPGYTATVLMNGLKTPRDLIFDSQGNLLIVEQGGAGVRLVKLTDNGGTNVCVASSKQLIADATVRTSNPV